jgi:hypothetical protein
MKFCNSSPGLAGRRCDKVGEKFMYKEICSLNNLDETMAGKFHLYYF